MIDEAHEAVIIEEVNRSAIRNQALKDDLIDHLCCLTEIHVSKGIRFEKSLQMALDQTAPNGLNEIQKETIFLLNYNKIIFMKRLTFIFGYLFTLTWVAGLLMKTLHLAGGALIMAMGALGVVGIFLPLLLVNRYKSIAREVLSERMKWFFGALSLVLLVASITMKMLHWQGAGLMLAVSVLIFGIGFLPFFFFRMYKKSITDL